MSESVAHRHQWKHVSTLDGCHWIETRFICKECGAESTDLEERDFHSDDPLQICFARQDCERCVQLAEGVEEPWGWRMTI